MGGTRSTHHFHKGILILEIEIFVEYLKIEENKL